MPGIIIVTASALAVIISFVNVWRVKRARKGLTEEFQGMWKWAGETRIVVRDKLGHENVADIRVLDLWVIFRTGQAFRNAKLLWDHNEFKVYAQGKQEDLGEWESIRKANEGE